MDWPLVTVVLALFAVIIGTIISLMIYLGTPFSLGMAAGLALYHFSGWKE